MKVVLDTNVLIDGFKDEYSYEKRVINEIIAGKIDAYANKQTLQENRLIIHQLLDNPEYTDELNNFFAQVTHVVNRHRIHVVPDEEDNKILESAVEAGADYLITNDRDLLGLGGYQDIKIVRAIDFWAAYKDEGADTWNEWANFLSGK
jgi:putative PIN family toxin of toxin-antitoxin system